MRRIAFVGLLVLALLGAGTATARRHHHRRHHHRLVEHGRHRVTRAGGSPFARMPAPVPVAPPVVTTPTPPAPPPPSPPPALARVQALEREYSITLSRPSVAAGPVAIEAGDVGEDPHDLHLRTSTGDVTSLATLLPGNRQTVKLTLAPGTYTLYCSIGDHEARGMHATLVVGG